MKRALRWMGAAAVALAAGGLHAAEIDIPLSTAVTGQPGGTAPYVNVLLRDFSDAGDMGSYEWIRNTIEVQVTTGSDKYDPGPCCPVQGKGNLAAGDRLDALYLSVSPRIDLSKLKVYWAGEPMAAGPDGSNVFAASGLKPTAVMVKRDGFSAGAAGAFDIMVQWAGAQKFGPDMPYVKLLLVYDNAKSDIGLQDFTVSNGAAMAAASVKSGGKSILIKD